MRPIPCLFSRVVGRELPNCLYMTEEIKRTVFKSETELNLIARVEPVVESQGYALRDVEVNGRGSSTTVRISLESLSDSVEIGIEDCTKVHRVLGPLFDVWDPISGAYTLEVSSPGERPSLRTLDHFKAAMGDSIKFQTLEPIEMPEPYKPRRNWSAQLDLVEDAGTLKLSDDFGSHVLSIEQIKNAVWCRTWESTKGGQAKKGASK